MWAGQGGLVEDKDGHMAIRFVSLNQACVLGSHRELLALVQSADDLRGKSDAELDAIFSKGVTAVRSGINRICGWV